MKKNELYHHGILGQRWGIRRFQNYDGTQINGAKAIFSSAGKRKELTPEELADKELRKQKAAETRKKVWNGLKTVASVTYDVARIAGSIYLAKQLGGIMAMEVIATGNKLATAGATAQMMSNGYQFLSSPEGQNTLNQTVATLDSADKLLSNPNVSSMYSYASNPQNQQNWINLISTASNAASSTMNAGAQSYANMASNTNVETINQTIASANTMMNYYQNNAM